MRAAQLNLRADRPWTILDSVLEASNGFSPRIPMMMKLISLDQCFLSEMALHADKNRKFRALRDVLMAARQNRKIACPAHVEEMIYESVLLPPHDRDQIVQLQNELSAELVFPSFYEALAIETLRLVRPIVPQRFRIGKIRLKDEARILELAAGIRASKPIKEAKATAMPVPSSYRPDMDLRAIFLEVSAERGGAMYRVLDSIAENGSVGSNLDEWDVAVAVGDFLLQKKVTAEECRALQEKVINREWEKIPILGYHTMILSKIERDILARGRKVRINDHLDAVRLVVALEFADIAAYDAKMVAILQETKLDRGRGGEPPELFSMRQVCELQKFVEAL